MTLKELEADLDRVMVQRNKYKHAMIELRRLTRGTVSHRKANKIFTEATDGRS